MGNKLSKEKQRQENRDELVRLLVIIAKNFDDNWKGK